MEAASRVVRCVVARGARAAPPLGFRRRRVPMGYAHEAYTPPEIDRKPLPEIMVRDRNARIDP